jgi:hypothetical protein
LFCFVLFAFLAPAFSIDWCFVTSCDKVVPHDTYAPSHQDCWNVFLLVSDKHMYILSSGQKSQEKYFDQPQICYDLPKQIRGIHWSKVYIVELFSICKIKSLTYNIKHNRHCVWLTTFFGLLYKAF